MLLIGCPKLDDVEFYTNKLTEIFRENDIQSVDVAHMEVPCCTGIVRAVKKALDNCGKEIPLTITRIGIDGQLQEVTGP